MASSSQSKVSLYGIPYSAGCRSETSVIIDQARAPQVIRAALQELQDGFDIPTGFVDCGDLSCDGSVPAVLDGVERFVAQQLESAKVPLLLGGAHTLTLGALRAIAKAGKQYSLIYLDAHPDLMPHPDINYGSILHYAVKEGILDPKRIAFIGARQIERPESEFISANGVYLRTGLDVEQVGLEQILKEIKSKFAPPFVLSLDLDSVDPSLCPGVTTPFPGGLTPRELLLLARELGQEPVLYADIVELAPANDRDSVSARLAAILLQTLAHAIGGIKGV